MEQEETPEITEVLKSWATQHPVTASLIGITLFINLLIGFTLLVATFSGIGRHLNLISYFYISLYPSGLPEILHGQVWRLISPAFIHFGVFHLLFNMLWLFELGSNIEKNQGSKRLLIIVLLCAVIANLGEYFWSSPFFGGMSGVVYGLLGYSWLQGKLVPESKIHIKQSIFIMIMGWYLICWTGLVGHIANMAHTTGLVCGLLLGYYYYKKHRLISQRL